MKFDPNKTSLTPRIRDFGDVQPAEKKRMSTPRKAALAGTLALAGAFSGAIVHAGVETGHKAVDKVEQTTSSDRAFNPDAGNPTPLTDESRQPAAGVSPELQEQTESLFEKLQAEAPKSVLYEYTVQEGDSPAGIVEKSVNVDGEAITDTVQYGADRMFIAAQIGEDGIHPGDIIKLAPGTDIPGQTTEIPPANPANGIQDYYLVLVSSKSAKTLHLVAFFAFLANCG